MHLQYQTSDNIPAPYAYAIELRVSEEKNEILVDFELTYLGREDLSTEDILIEGFTENDDFQWKGKLNQTWLAHYNELFNSLKLVDKGDFGMDENYWQIKLNNEVGFPKNEIAILKFLQELQQAALEASKTEAPLHIQLMRITKESINTYVFNASFKERRFYEIRNELTNELKWDSLEHFLKNIYAGEFRTEQARENPPKKRGLYINLGDDFWFELGKSYLIQPSIVQQFID